MKALWTMDLIHTGECDIALNTWMQRLIIVKPIIILMKLCILEN